MKIDTLTWNKVNLGDIAQSLTIATKDPLSEGLERYVGLEHIEPGDIHIKSWGNIADGTTFTRVFRKGQVLFGKRRAYQKKAALAEFDGVCSGDILVCEAIKGSVLPELLPFIVQSDRFFEYAIKTSAGSLSPRTKFKDLAKFSLRLPTLGNQKPIAELLWSIDQVEREYSNLIKNLETLIASYMNSVLESKKLSKARVSEIAKVTAGNSAPQGDKYFNGDKKFVRVQHILSNEVYVSKCDFVNDLAVRECRLKLFPAKTILFPKSGASVYLEKKAMLKESSYVVSHLCAVMVNEEKVMPEYLLYIFKGSRLSKNCAGGYPTIDLNGVKNWDVPLPSMQEQAVIVQRINLLEGLRDKIVIQFKSSTEIKKQIINQIFG